MRHSRLENIIQLENEKDFRRLMGLLKDTKGKVVYKAGGETDEKDRFIPFHLLEVDSADDILLQEEVSNGDIEGMEFHRE